MKTIICICSAAGLLLTGAHHLGNEAVHCQQQAGAVSCQYEYCQEQKRECLHQQQNCQEQQQNCHEYKQNSYRHCHHR